MRFSIRLVNSLQRFSMTRHIPETMTSKADATRMFFEVLVLATKSAVTVKQPNGQLGGPIRIQEKRGLWGFRAEAGRGEG